AAPTLKERQGPAGSRPLRNAQAELALKARGWGARRKESGDELLGDGKGAAEAEGARSDFDSGGGLLALVFAVIDLDRDVAYQVERKAEVRGDLLGRAHFLDVGFQDAVEEFVR